MVLGFVLCAVLLLAVSKVDQAQACDVILRLSAEDTGSVLINRIIEDYHNCLKCIDDDGEIDPNTMWRLHVNGMPLTNPEAFTVFNGTLLLLNATAVVPRDGSDVDAVANCYTPDMSINRNFSLYSNSFLPPAVRTSMINKQPGETVMLTCTNNNPPTLASEIQWVQGGAILASQRLSEDSNVNMVTYSTDEVGVYQCQVLSAADNNALLLVNVTVTEGGATGGATRVQPYVLTSIVLMPILYALY